MKKSLEIAEKKTFSIVEQPTLKWTQKAPKKIHSSSIVLQKYYMETS